jgi:hypothetical protein
LTTVSQLIIDAYRQSNLLAIGAAPTPNQEAEALRYLNRLVLSVLGNEVSNELSPIAIGRNGINRPQGYPWYDQVPPGQWFVPKNTQLMFNLTSPVEVWLNPIPDDGSRFAVSDISGNFSTNTVTIHGNGRNIEGSQTLVLNTDGIDTQWFYRQDTANWVKYTPLIAADTFPYPESFDFYFISLLALHLNPSYDVEASPTVGAIFKRAKTQFQARYQSHIQVVSELGITRMPNQTADRRWYQDSCYNPTSLFNSGYPYTW